MEPENPIWFIILAIAAIAVVAFYIAWSRRSTPTGPPQEDRRLGSESGAETRREP